MEGCKLQATAWEAASYGCERLQATAVRGCKLRRERLQATAVRSCKLRLWATVPCKNIHLSKRTYTMYTLHMCIYIYEQTYIHTPIEPLHFFICMCICIHTCTCATHTITDTQKYTCTCACTHTQLTKKREKFLSKSFEQWSQIHSDVSNIRTHSTHIDVWEICHGCWSYQTRTGHVRNCARTHVSICTYICTASW